MSRTYFAYCPNPECGYRRGPDGSRVRDSFVQGLEAQPVVGLSCPHCQTSMRTDCPHCGEPFPDVPRRFCPACGGDLTAALPDAPCRICGRPCRRSVALHAAGGDEVSVCSDHCLRVLIQRHVRICDHCGRRFLVELQPGAEPSTQAAPHPGESLREFCSPQCRAEHLLFNEG